MNRWRYTAPGGSPRSGPEGDGGLLSTLAGVLLWLLFPEHFPGNLELERTTYIRDLDLRHQSGGLRGSSQGLPGSEARA